MFCGEYENNFALLHIMSDVAQYIFDSSVANMKISGLSSTFDLKSSMAR